MPPANSSENKKNKLIGLEIIRFISAISVLFWHYQHFFYISYSPINFTQEKQPFYSAFRLAYDYGYYGVQVFWCISGFIFFWKYQDAIAENVISHKKFFVLRFSRLYPLHFITLLLVALLQAIYFSKAGYNFAYQYNDNTHFFLQLFLASNWGFERGHSFNSPIWSISIEVLVYILFFTTSRHIGKSLLVSIAVLLLCIAAKFAKFPTQIINCFVLFYMGGISATALQYINKTKYKKKIYILSFFIILAEPIIAYFLKLNQSKHFEFLFVTTYVPILLYFVTAKDFGISPRIQKSIETAANMTYSSYLIHFPIQTTLALYFLSNNQDIPYYDPAFFAFFMASVLISSHYIYKFFELPTQQFIRNKFS